MLSVKKGSSILSQYFNWLREIIGWRLQNMDEDFCSMVKRIPVPVHEYPEEEVFTKLVKELGLTAEEQLVLLLSLSPYFIPDYQNSNSEVDAQIRNILLLNKSLFNSSHYPTIETAMVLLGGNNVNSRQKYYTLFGKGSRLYREDVIAQPRPPENEPFTRSYLTPGQMVLNNILSGEVKGPEFSHDFPAMLIASDYEWDDLIVDYDTLQQLEEVKEWLEYEKICKQKGLNLTKFRKGYKALFHGPPGTGKTLAATLIGKLTNHKVYRIDLSAVVSKYIGETEKNLSRVFDRASHGNWILFFDEADALFGKRGATQNAHDRYANQEVAYLLQRFESYEGVSILASNFKDNIDSAFYRRFHGIVSFKRPEQEERLRLWQVHLPKGFKYAEDINLEEIAFNIKITGAGIYNVLRRSCMKAVLKGDMVITGKDMYESVKKEFAKENKTI